MNSRMMLPIELTKILYQKWEGQISTSSQDSQIYGKCLNGHGKVTFKNGNKYQGNFFNGLLNGQGKFIWANGIVYQGQFTDNRITGKGIYKWPDNSIYEGEVKDGLRHGAGKYSVDDATYEGQWKQGKKQGKGKIIFKSGSIFEGNFKNDMKDGFGKMYYYPSGNFFEGQWEKDVKCGYGTMNWTDIREKYMGNWKNNQQEGWGIHIWLQSKGQGKYMRNRYQGNWKGGVRDGYGVFYYANGSKYEGYWKDNMKQGYSFYTDENGKNSLILFKKDRMMKGQKPTHIQVGDKKVANKKQVQPNYYSLCLSIDHFYQPVVTSLEQLYNYLLRNNTQLKAWYKSASSFYDQQSQFSFCLNLEGTWKMLRSLKILGQFSLAQFDRGMPRNNPSIQSLLKIIPQSSEEYANYQNIYYRYLSSCEGNIINNHIESKEDLQQIKAFNEYNVHDRECNVLFRQFVHQLIWMAHHIQAIHDKPHKSIEKLITKIGPFLESLTKASKMAFNQNNSENKSSISKTQKNLSPFYRNVNSEIFKDIVKDKTSNLLGKKDQTLRIRQLIGYGRLNGCIGQAQLLLLQKIIQKYFQTEILNKPKKQMWQTSTISSKILNVLNYEMIQYEFAEILYILFVKKLPSTKQNEENKKKYQEVVRELSDSKNIQAKKQQKFNRYINQTFYIKSNKSAVKNKMTEKRRVLQEIKAKTQLQAKQKQRQAQESQMMKRQDFDIKDIQFQEEASDFQI